MYSPKFIVHFDGYFSWLWFSFLSISQGLAGKCISRMTYFVLSGTLNLNSANQTIKQVDELLTSGCFGAVLADAVESTVSLV